MSKDQQDHSIEVEQQGQKSASLIGDQTKVFQVDGDLYYQETGHQPPHKKGVPLALIPETGIFLNRDHLLTEIEHFFQQAVEKVFFLEGLGGIGKTVLAAYACRKFRHYFHEVYWGHCTQENEVGQFLEELHGLFTRHEESSPNCSWNDKNLPLHTRINDALEHLEQGNYLLVFDDFHSLLDRNGRIQHPDMEVFFQELFQGGHHAKLLLISRRRCVFNRQPTGISLRKRLGGLKIAVAKALLDGLGMELSLEQLRRLHDKVGGHPLALRILTDLHERGLSLERLATSPFRELSRESKELCDDLFSGIWEIMKPEERQILQGMSTFRIAVPIEAISAFMPTSPSKKEGSADYTHLERFVRFLYENCLLERKKNLQDSYLYSVPGLVRDFIFKNLTKPQQQKHHSNAAIYFISDGSRRQNPITFQELQKRQEAIYHLFQAGEEEQATKLALSLSESLRRCGLGDLAKDILLETEGTLLSDEDRAISYNQLGNISVLQGNYLDALQHYKRAHRIWQRVGNTEGVATVENNIGTVYASGGDYPQALFYYKKAEKKLKQLQLESELATSYNNIGFAYAGLGDYIQSLKYHEQAKEIQTRLHIDIDLASSYNNIGFLYDTQREYDLALEYYKKARKIREQLGLEVDLAESYNNIGSVYAAQGECDKSLSYYQQAQDILNRLGLEVNLAKCYNNVGLVHTEQGNFEQALEEYQRAKEIQERLGLHADLAKTLNNMGVVYATWEDNDEHVSQALQYYDQAREIQERLGLEANLAITFENLGQLYYRQGNYERAEKAITLALSFRKKLNHPDAGNDITFLEQIRNQVIKERQRETSFLTRFKQYFQKFTGGKQR